VATVVLTSRSNSLLQMFGAALTGYNFLRSNLDSWLVERLTKVLDLFVYMRMTLDITWSATEEETPARPETSPSPLRNR